MSNNVGVSMQMGSVLLWRECREKRMKGQGGGPREECGKRLVRKGRTK